VQDDGLPAEMNDSAEDHGHDGIKPRCRPGVILMIMTIRGGLLGRDRMEPSMRIATDKRQGK
jgi:hypothetical protein